MTLALLGSSTKDVFKVSKDPYGREPFHHPATEGIEILNGRARAHLLHHKQISRVAFQYGLQTVIRWNPRKVTLLFVQCTMLCSNISGSRKVSKHLAMKWFLRKQSLLS